MKKILLSLAALSLLSPVNVSALEPHEYEWENIPEEGTSKNDDGVTMNYISINPDIQEVKQSGDFIITLHGAHLTTAEFEDSLMIEMYSEEVTIVQFMITVENVGGDGNNIHPDQGTFVTNDGQQLNADLFQSGDVGGEFYEGVKKTGSVLFILEGFHEDISGGRFIIDAPSDENFMIKGDDIEFKVSFTDDESDEEPLVESE